MIFGLFWVFWFADLLLRLVAMLVCSIVASTDLCFGFDVCDLLVFISWWA